MAVRVDGADLTPLDAPTVAQAFPAATGRISVFVHGLAQDEVGWRRKQYGMALEEAEDDAVEPPTNSTYASQLRDDLAITAVFVRYNTGLPIVDNGIALAHLLEGLLVAGTRIRPQPGGPFDGGPGRGRCRPVGAARGLGWAGALGSIVTLGSPHRERRLRASSTAAPGPLALAPGPTVAQWARVTGAGSADLCIDGRRRGAMYLPEVPMTIISTSRSARAATRCCRMWATAWCR